MSNWTQPICEACWIDKEGQWEEIDEVHSRLVTLRQPVMTREAGLHQCALCGGPTFVGIFQRIDPATVPYPALDSDPSVEESASGQSQSSSSP